MRGKRVIIGGWTVVCLLLAVAGASPAFAGPQTARDNAAPAAAKDEAPLAGPKERRSYALGMVLGDQFREQSIEVDTDLYVRGLKDGLSGGRTLLTGKEARAIVNAIPGELKKKRAAPQASGALEGIAVSFKLDPRLTRSMYMGERWVSPPVYQPALQEGKTLTVEARVHGVDAKGNKMKITPTWTPSDSGMVAVTSGKGSDFNIEVKRAGKSTLSVAAQGVSKELTIKAIEEGNAIRVEIAQ